MEQTKRSPDCRVTFGRIYGDPAIPAYITPEGPVWMRRKGQRVRFFTAQGVQVGPEHRNVYPAILSASYEGWIDPCNPQQSAACTAEVHGKMMFRVCR